MGHRGARLITMTPGPWYGRFPADSYFDPFWSRVNAQRLGAIFHAHGGIPAAYSQFYREAWSKPPVSNQTHSQMLRGALLPYHRPVMDSLMALVLEGRSIVSPMSRWPPSSSPGVGRLLLARARPRRLEPGRAASANLRR